MVEVAVHHEQGIRATMEDEHTCIENLGIALAAASCPQSLFGVFDGHGGVDCGRESRGSSFSR